MANEIQHIDSSEDFQRVCDIIEIHRSQALNAVNLEHLLTCWEVGAFVSDRLHNGQWGDSVVCALADYIKRNRPDLKGYGKSNLYNMVKFYQAYSSEAFTSFVSAHPALQQMSSLPLPAPIFQPAVGKIDSNENFQPVVGEFPAILQLNRAVVQYALSKSMSPTMVAEYERVLIPREVMQHSLNEYIDMIC